MSHRKNVALLAAAQALLLTNGIMLVSINGLLGLQLAADKRLATLPITTYVIGGALATLPAAFFMKRYGRRAGFMLGAGIGMLGAAISAFAVSIGSFWLLCFGTVFAGIYNAFGQQYRFAAADAAPLDWKGKAISLTLAGGIIGGVIGPEVGKLTRSLLEPTYLASYAALIGFAAVSMLIASRLDIPPLSVADTAFILQWHVIGMFAPSFFTGDLIKRFGVLTILIVGAALMFLCIGIALSGVTLMHFWWALVLLGIGWNFLFIGGTTLLTETYRPEEKAKVQGTNDFLVLGVQGLTSLSSGVLVTSTGWASLNTYALPIVAMTALATALFWLYRRSARGCGA